MCVFRNYTHPQVPRIIHGQSTVAIQCLHTTKVALSAVERVFFRGDWRQFVFSSSPFGRLVAAGPVARKWRYKSAPFYGASIYCY